MFDPSPPQSSSGSVQSSFLRYRRQYGHSTALTKIYEVSESRVHNVPPPHSTVWKLSEHPTAVAWGPMFCPPERYW